MSELGRIERRVRSSLHVVLREELEARHWSSSQLAKQLGVRLGVVSRWLTADCSKRVVPLPQVCVHIAETFGWDPVDVFRTAGYLPMDKASPPHDKEIRAAKRLLVRTLNSIPEHEWEVAYPIVCAYLDGLPHILSRLDQREQRAE